MAGDDKRQIVVNVDAGHDNQRMWTSTENEEGRILHCSFDSQRLCERSAVTFRVPMPSRFKWTIPSILLKVQGPAYDMDDTMEERFFCMVEAQCIC
mmetsp:Transcript_4589/g.6835  ORF Transcript_4589/g.6835 Transcript_4589/m.6835 type:complete len:96 (-) Transcript_4589:61-348(-)|eukprot:scaffold10195_cov70-Skeletonema_dohrnii-CCMP3373.AAC.4